MPQEMKGKGTHDGLLPYGLPLNWLAIISLAHQHSRSLQSYGLDALTNKIEKENERELIDAKDRFLLSSNLKATHSFLSFSFLFDRSCRTIRKRKGKRKTQG